MLYGVVTLYFPNEENLKNIETYVHKIDKLYLFDNTPVDNSKFIQKIKWNNVEYISFSENKGLSFAYDYCISLAIKNGANYFLIMDQDSSFKNFYEHFDILKETISAKSINSIGQICLSQKNGDSPKMINGCISSGSIIVLKNYMILEDGFSVNFFIDFIDNDISYQFLKHGKATLQINCIDMIHQMTLGDKIEVSLFNKRFETLNEPFYRYYYIVRNSTLTKSTEFFPLYYDLKGMIVCTFVRKKDRFKCLKAIIDGLIDGKKKKTGMYKYHKKYEQKMVKKYLKNQK